ncbi:transglycosylase associated protein [Leptospira ryugenii]|uniref:Transglycosylase associated protein n=1 Tax=Leptospira ryugenii TaxID=1917863 RepID=A0A2P2E342_9LEPT|nr:GlsB/YeaQ/YmgE family stress response membrane protein [Leptospira ryugenii]GBF51290.1 transglycosylase associated protein [Leptospira ryugenii]
MIEHIQGENNSDTMDVKSFILFLLVGAIAGWLTGKILRGKGFGLIANLVIGVIGSFLGGLLAQFIGLSGSGVIADIAIALGGSIVLVYLLGLVKK